MKNGIFTRRGGQEQDAAAAVGAMPEKAAPERAAAAVGAIRVPPITDEIIAKAAQTLGEYKAAKANLETRTIENQQWWKLRNIYSGEDERKNREVKKSAWLFNAIANKHADVMDNVPEISCLAREKNDAPAATELQCILPCIYDECNFERVYSDCWYDKLIFGTGIYGVFWDKTKDNGIGNVAIREIDLLNIFWEPGISDIQSSKNVFHVELWDNDKLTAAYPQLEDKVSTPAVEVSRYIYDDAVSTADKTAVVDWYYKKRIGTKTVLHYCKFANGILLYSSENDAAYAERGFYDHGRYPFVFDRLFAIKGTPCGLGYIDYMRGVQEDIDELSASVTRYAKMTANPRFFVRADGGINEEEYADFTKPFIHYSGSGDPNDSISPIKMPEMPAAFITHLNNKIQELKETSGNNDMSNGGTAGGVTAASAIAALQEASGKQSRDMISGAYRCFEQISSLVIELIRQFYSAPRAFRIIGDTGEAQYIAYDNRSIAGNPNSGGGYLADHYPIIDVKAKAHKKSAFSRISQNELAKELYAGGWFDPSRTDQSLAALKMMEFDGKDAVEEQIRQNGGMAQEIAQLREQLYMLASYISGETPAAQTQQGAAQTQQGAAPPQQSGGRMLESDSLGRAVQTSSNVHAGTAAQRAASVANPDKIEKGVTMQ